MSSSPWNGRLLPSVVVSWDAGYFQSLGGKAWLENRIGTLDDARHLLSARLAQPPACRPARIDVAATDVEHIPWQGYYTGAYLSQDYSAAENLAPLQRIRSNPALYRFGLLPWSALLLPQGRLGSPEQMVAAPAAPLQCVHYGTTQLEYQVNLASPATVVENEAYFQGWSAEIEGKHIDAVDANGFRSWTLPAGQYRMTSTFRQPWHVLGLLVTALGALCWLALLGSLFRNRQHE